MITMPGHPIAVQSTSYEGALDETVDALREYAADWNERLFAAPNHEEYWGLVTRVGMSPDAAASLTPAEATAAIAQYWHNQP